jgi:hypothetical protein
VSGGAIVAVAAPISIVSPAIGTGIIPIVGYIFPFGKTSLCKPAPQRWDHFRIADNPPVRKRRLKFVRASQADLSNSIWHVIGTGTIGTGMVLTFELLIKLELLYCGSLCWESAWAVPDPSFSSSWRSLRRNSSISALIALRSSSFFFRSSSQILRCWTKDAP